MLEIEKICDYARYSDTLETFINRLNGKEVLRLDYDSDYQGYVDIDVLLEDGRVFSYMYWYGSCSGCDEWEAEGFSDEEIIKIMTDEATFFNNKTDYDKWRSIISDSK